MVAGAIFDLCGRMSRASSYSVRRGGRSDTRSGSGRVFRIFGYFGIGIENPFGYFCTSDRVRVFLVWVQLF
ncbi:unnamed protein product [Brassica oleracea]